MKNEFINQYVEYSMPPIGQSIQHHQGVGLIILTAVLNGRRWIEWGARQYTNLFLILLGNTGTAKSAISDVGINLLRDIEEDSNSPFKYIMPDISSPEACINRLAEYNKGLMYWDEVSKMLALMRKEHMASYPEFLTSMYTCPRVISKDLVGYSAPKIIRNPCFDIFGSSSVEGLHKEMGGKLTRGYGWWQRFQFIPSDPGGQYARDPKRRTIESWKNMKRELYLVINSRDPDDGMGFRNASSRKAYDEYLHALLQEESPYKGSYIRIGISALKISMALASTRIIPSTKLPDGISMDDIDDAKLFCSHFINALPQVFTLGDNFFAEKKIELIKLTERFPGAVPYAYALSELEIEKYRFDSILETLITTGAVEAIQENGEKKILKKK